MTKFLWITVRQVNVECIFLHQIVAVVKGLGYRVVCEGVENLEQVDVLRTAGCEEAQGFWFAHPMPVEEFEQIMYQKMPYQKV